MYIIRLDAFPSGSINIPNGSEKVSPRSTTKTTMENIEALFDSIKSLATDPATNDILGAIDAIPALKEKIKRLEEEEKVSHKARQKLHDDYNNYRDRWLKEKAKYEEQIAALGREAQQKQQTIVSLQHSETTTSKRIEMLEAKVTKQKEDLEGGQKKFQGIVKAIETERDTRRGLEDTLRSCNTTIAQLESERNDLANDRLKWKNDAERATSDLNAAAELTVPLTDDMGVVHKMDRVWDSATSLIWTFFWRDLALDSPTTKSFWPRLERQGLWIKSVPLPASNTDTAKTMRSVIIVAALARIFDDFLFEPTYHLPHNSGVRELLLQQAADNGAKEAAIRAQFQALLPRERETARSRRVEETRVTFMRLIEGLLSPAEEQKLQTQLTKLAEDACRIWEEICCYTDAVEPRFDLQIYSDWPWKTLVFQGDRCDIVEQDPDETPIVAIFPRLYAWYKGESIAETHGVGLMKAQVALAEQEIESLPSSPRVDRNTSLRQQRDRRISTSVDLAGASSTRHFLGRGS
ncbi:Hypothetical protein R9X50_00527000 [Acrodontium crateriforme]|uniref:Uncharacterized protein n=1 Tax=Acrodontium crateriforme TaxID=150365 RepID=A0AAQ3M7I9_9PEZI|nr:Hypothetical protein R9X50_00527000 [Acrodontium crateriforme]